MSVRANAEGFFQEYEPVEIPYEKYSVREIVNRQMEASKAFFRESQPHGDVPPYYPPLRDVGVRADNPEGRAVNVYEARATLVSARLELVKSIHAVARLHREDVRLVRGHIDSVKNYVRTLERRGKG